MRTAATVSSLATANDVVHKLGQAGADPSTALHEPTLAEIKGALATLATIAARVPREYIDSTTRMALADSALGLDLWISSPQGRLDKDLLSSSQVTLREFVSSFDSAPVRLFGSGSSSSERGVDTETQMHQLVTADIAALLVETSSTSARGATMKLCRTQLFEYVKKRLRSRGALYFADPSPADPL